MDNLTHGLCGALVAELWCNFAPKSLRPQRRALTYAASIAANNLPDLDLVLTGLVDGKLGYLLHHRGHTHTLPGALVLGAALWAAIAFGLRRSATLAQADRRGLAVLCGLGVLLHLLLDFGNNYGVHPFWPVDADWYFGDLVFIIEPWWWSVPAACLAGSAQSRVARGALWFVWVVAVAATWALPLPAASGVYATVVSVLAALLGMPRALVSLSARRRALLGGLALLGLYGVQLGGRTLARKRLDAALQLEARGSDAPMTVLDVVATPLPATPWCWDFLVVGISEQGQSEAQYVLYTARASAWPALTAAERCPSARPSPTAALQAVSRPASQSFTWDGEYRLPAADWRRLSADCFARAFLQYARAPFFVPETGAMGDLRYDRAPELEFAELEHPPLGAPCPNWLPNWQSPRQDVEAALRSAGER